MVRADVVRVKQSRVDKSKEFLVNGVHYGATKDARLKIVFALCAAVDDAKVSRMWPITA